MIAEIPKNSHIYIISSNSRTLHSYGTGLAIVSLADRKRQREDRSQTLYRFSARYSSA